MNIKHWKIGFPDKDHVMASLERLPHSVKETVFKKGLSQLMRQPFSYKYV